jgi:hypothetical protein
MEEKELLINTSEEYLFEVKTTNFKIILNKLVETLENLDTDDENYENDMYNVIMFGEELIKQFDLIQNKILDYHDKRSASNIKNMENKIKTLSKNILDHETMINDLNALLSKEKERYDTLNKDNNENKIKVEKSNKTITELETLLNNQGFEIMKLHTEINAKDNNSCEDITIIDNNLLKKSPEYLSKLNEGNIKVIQTKNEKIKSLQFELNDIYRKLNALIETNNELQNTNQKLQEHNTELNTLIETNNELQNNNQKLQEHNTELSNLLHLNSVNENELKSVIECHNNEIIFLNSRIHSLEDENYNLKLYKDNNTDDITKPLLERNHTITFFEPPTTEKQTCNFCNIL